MESSQPRLARLSGLSLASSGAIHLLGAIAGILTARFLGPEGKGLLVVIMLWPGLLAAVGGGLGLEDALVYFTAREPGRRGAFFATGAALACLQSTVLTVLGWLLLPWLLQVQDATVIADARLYLAWILLSHLTLTAMAVLQGSLSFKSLNVLRMVLVSCTAVGLAGLYAASVLSVHVVILLYLGANSVSLVAAWAVALRKHHSFRPDLRLAKQMVTYAAKAQIGHIAAVANERIDLAMLSLLLASSQLGLYAAALSLSSGVRLFGSSFALVAFPVLARPPEAPERGARDLGALVRATVYSSLACAIVIFAFVPATFTILFGSAFDGGIAVAQVLVWATVALNSARVLSAGLKAANLPATASVGEVLGATATVISLFALIPRFGLLGAGLASLLSYLVSLTYLAWAIHRHLGLRARDLVVPTRADLAWVQAAARELIVRAAPASA